MLHLSLTKIVSMFYLKDINLPKLSREQSWLCESELTEKEVIDTLSKMENDKTSGNYGLTKEFFEIFLFEIKLPLLLSLQTGFLTEESSTSQKQAVTKLLEKKNRDKKLMKIWSLIYPLNIDVKLISEDFFIIILSFI